jgi:hypothetical protein
MLKSTDLAKYFNDLGEMTHTGWHEKFSFNKISSLDK